jgi:hypothetical protein
MLINVMYKTMKSVRSEGWVTGGIDTIRKESRANYKESGRRQAASG